MSCQWTPLTTEMADALLQGGGWGEFGELTGSQTNVLKKEIRDGLAKRFGMTTAQVADLLALQANGGIDTETALHQESNDMLLFARMPDGTPYIWVVSCFDPDTGLKTSRGRLVWAGVGIMGIVLVGVVTAAMITSPKKKR